MKKLAILFVVLIMMLAGVLGCDRENIETGPGLFVPEKPFEKIEFTSYPIVKDHGTEYVIIIPSQSSKGEGEAAGLLSDYIHKSTGVYLPVLTDSSAGSVPSGKYISIGENSFTLAADVDYDISKLGKFGYRFITKDKALYVLGGSTPRAYIYAAYQLLHYLINFEAYYYDEIVFDNLSTIYLPDIDIEDVPDIEYRALMLQELYLAKEPELYKNTLRYDLPKIIGGYGHSSFTFIDPEVYLSQHPDWFAYPGREQLCFTNEDMIEELIKNVLVQIQQTPEADYVHIGQQDDTNNWCRCSRCTKMISDCGGNNSATLLYAINKVCLAVKEYLDEHEPGRKIKVSTFAYLETENAPVVYNETTGKYELYPQIAGGAKKMPANFNVQVALVFDKYNVNIYSGENEKNAKLFRTWNDVADSMSVWDYGVNFRYYLNPFPNFNAIPDNLKFFAEHKVSFWICQMAYNTFTPDFTELRAYINMKLAWDVNADYESLIKNFIRNYYKDAASSVYRYFSELRDWQAINKFDGGVYANNLVDKSKWPKELLMRWEKYFNEAFQSIEYLKDIDSKTYQKLYARIEKESIPVKQMLIELYASEFTSAELMKRKMECRQAIENAGIEQFSENHAISTLWARWEL